MAANAKVVDFAGWDMPLHYGSQLNEHHQVRKSVGMFDVSHMGVVDIAGEQVQAFLRYLLANNIDRLQDGKALYSCMLNDAAGVIDDLIVYRIHAQLFRLVINAGRREQDLAWIRKAANDYQLTITERHDLAMLAVQGPQALAALKQILDQENYQTIASLKPFHFSQINNWFIARTGYTGEDGVEIILPNQDAAKLWQQLLTAQVAPCGLGARDTLRLEAGMNLYGQDMDETISPLEANLSWTVILDPADRQFIGRAALEKQKQQGVKQKLVGLVLQGKGIMRHHQKVLADTAQGLITSGGYSPTLDVSIAMARVPADMTAQCMVEIRDKPIAALVVKLPFVRHGKKMF